MSIRGTRWTILSIAALLLAAPARSESLPHAPAPTAEFDAGHRIEYPGLIAPINFRRGAPNPVVAYLFRPSGTGPFPALVMISGCTGIERLPGYRRWVDRFVSWGYVTLAVDSLTSRHAAYCENRMAVDRTTISGDAYGALNWLSSRPEVQGARIGAIGFSYGANALLMAVESSGEPPGGLVIEGLYPAIGSERFRAVVAFYPTQVTRHLRFAAPVLILEGDQDRYDNWPELIWLSETNQRLGDPTQLHLYPAATHGFDMEVNSADGQIEMRYNAEATADAARRVRAFLERSLGLRPEPP